MMGWRLGLFLSAILVSLLLCPPVLSDLVISKLDRRIDLTSQIARVTSTLKVENEGSESVTEVLLAFPELQGKHLAHIEARSSAGKGKMKGSGTVSYNVEVVSPKGIPASLICYSVALPKGLGKGESTTFDVLAVFTHVLSPFPEEISQADVQLLVYQDTAHYLSPYAVKTQTLSVKFPSARIESYTKLEKTKNVGSEIKYGPYENLAPFSYTPVVVHFESHQPFAVAEEVVREIEISHWGNVQVTEHYKFVHGGARSKGEFSRLDFQTRPDLKGRYAVRGLIARLPARAHSVYYRDEIGNVSTSNLWSDSKKTTLEIEPRYPLIGGWKTTFTIGYGLPLRDFLFQSDGKRFIDINFGSPMNEVVINTLIVKVVLPEGSRDISVSAPFLLKESKETKFSHLDIAGRPVVVLEKTNVVPEHNQKFQVYYKFNSLAMLMEPLMLISGFFFLFVTGIVYMHVDFSISKSSASYLAQLQWDEVRATTQQSQHIVNRALAILDKLEASLRDLSRTGDIQACKAARKAADGSLKELSKEIKPLLVFLQSSPQAAPILTKVEELVTKERDLEEKLMVKHSTVVDCYEKKYGGKEIENRVASQQQKLTALRLEVDDLLEYIDEI